MLQQVMRRDEWIQPNDVVWFIKLIQLQRREIVKEDFLGIISAKKKKQFHESCRNMEVALVIYSKCTGDS
jgi:hypothetical protein